MPTVYANTSDGFIKSLSTVSWSDARDATTGGAADNTGQNLGTAVGSIATTLRGGGTQFVVYRDFFEFDFTGVTNVNSATLSLKNISSTTPSIRVVKAGNFGTLDTGDFDNIPGFSAGNTMAGNVTDFIDSAVVLTGSGDVTTITLNSTAIADMNANDKFIIAVVGDTYDYRNVTPSVGTPNIGGMSFADIPGDTTGDPQISYTTGAVGRSADAGGTKSKDQLRERQNITTEITADTDFEFKLVNSSKSPVYFNLEGIQDKDIFNTASFRTTTSDSGSNVLSFISQSQNSSFIIAGESTASFFLSSSTTIPGNSIRAVATNLKQLTPTGTNVFGVSMEVLS